MPADAELYPWPDAFAQHYRALGLWQNELLYSILQQACARDAQRTAIIDGRRRWSYAQLQCRAGELAVGFKALGLHCGDKVVVQLPNCGEFFEVLFALFKIGVVPVLALPAHRGYEISQFIEQTNAKAYICADHFNGFDYRELARFCCEPFPTCKVIVHGHAQEFCALALLYLAGTSHSTVEPDALALLQLSGGTTGAPKLIPRTHNDYLYSVRQSVQVCGFDKHTTYLSVLPVAHNFPLSSPGALGVLYAGGTLVLSDSGAPDVALPLIERYSVTHCALVPPLAIAWMNAQNNNSRALSSLRVVQVGGAKFSREAALRFFQVFTCQLQQVFGMAEGLVNYTRLSDSRETIVGTQGKPMSPFDEVRIVDNHDQPVAMGEVGHLLARGPYTIRGYYRAGAYNRKAFTADGFYRTGDLARFDRRGYLVVEGRDKDQINRGGEKVAAEEVENHLLAHAEVLDAAVVAMPDAYLGERTCAFIILRSPTYSLSLLQVRKFLKTRGLADYKFPDRLEVVENFPTTKLGKVNKNALKVDFSATPV